MKHPRGSGHVAFQGLCKRDRTICHQGLCLPPTETANVQKVCLKSYSVIVSYLLKHFATDDNIATVEADIQTFKLQDITTK